MSKRTSRPASELSTGDRVKLTDGTTATVTDAYPVGTRLTWLELSGGESGAVPSGTMLTVVSE